MPKIQQLSPHVADLIAAGEVVERPASAAKELIENAIDAGAKSITVELHNGGMTFLRVTDDGCGIAAEDVQTAFLRHATSKLRCAEDLEAIGTLGFRGEALAAISSVSRIDLLTKTADAPFGVSLHLDGGEVTERGEAGCPDGTTIIVRDLFFNTPARMKFMKRDTVEASAVLSVVQRMALAHPEIAMRVIRDGEEQLHTAGDGSLHSAVYAVMGRQTAQEMISVSGKWENTLLTGFVSKPTATRGTRSNQIFFVNGRLVRSKTMTAALEEAYRNQIMVGRFPSCVLNLQLPENLVDVNVHPAKTEVKFLRERDVFDSIHYGVLGALNGTSGRVEMQLPQHREKAQSTTLHDAAQTHTVPKQDFFRTMRAEDYRNFAQTVRQTPKVQPSPAVKEALFPTAAAPKQPPAPPPAAKQPPKPAEPTPVLPSEPTPAAEPVQQELSLPTQDYRIVGEVLDTYIIVEQGQDVLLIDKHAAHERILFEKLKTQEAALMPQLLLRPILTRAEPQEAALLLENEALLRTLGYELSDYGGGTLAIRQIPAELSPDQAADSLSALAEDIAAGRRLDAQELREKLLHTVACKAAIKGGQHSAEQEREALVRQVLTREDLKYCPHGRPICAVLTARQLERQFKRA